MNVKSREQKINRGLKTVRSKIWGQRNLILGALIGAACFILIYGTKILNPTYDGWIMAAQSDLTQHYQGWKFFRKDAWSFPVGLFGNLSYPIKASIIFMDSIPLMAVFFKLLSPLLPGTFQYFGIWGLLCFILQGAISAKILEKYLKNTFAVCAGTLFFTTSFLVIFRMFMHTSLASQWLILLSVLFLVYYREYFSSLKHAVIGWAAVGFLSASTHLYFLPMCGIVLLGFICRDLAETRKIRRAVILLFSFLVSGVVAVWLWGGFSCGGSAAGNGLGEYSFNLNGFFNSRGCSRFLPSLAYALPGQLEGFCYLGIGVLILIPVSAVLFLIANRKHLAEKNWWKTTALSVLPWAVIVLLSVGAALSPSVTWYDKVLFTVPVPSLLKKIWSIFRATGRLVWPAAYVLMLFAICAGFQYGKRWAAGLVLAVCAFLQIYDMQDEFADRRKSYEHTITYENPLNDPVWSAVGSTGKIRHLVMADMYSATAETMYRLADYSDRYGMDQNYYHYAHSLGEGPTIAFQELMGNLREDTMYVFEQSSRLKLMQYDLHYYPANGYLIGLTWAVPGIDEVNADELGSISYGFKDNQWLSGGEDIDGARHIHQGGVSYGPYMAIPDGTYRFVVTGENLEGGNYACTCSSGKVKLALDDLEVKETEVSFRINLPDGASSFELVVSNPGADDIILRQVTIQGVKYGE